MIVLPQMRGVLAHHSSAAPALIPKIAYALLGTDQSTTSTTYSSLLSCSITVAGTSDIVQIIMSASADVQTTGGTPNYQITVDGTAVGYVRATSSGVGFSSASRVVSVTGLSAGSHTVVLNWKSANGNNNRILASTTPSQYHATLVCRIATSGATYTTLGTSQTSSATSPTDALLTGISFTSTAASSALYIRASACGAAGANQAVFRLFVDGIGVRGSGDSADSAGSRFNTSIVHVVPVTAGTHTIDFKWGGGGGTIDPTSPGTDPFAHAAVFIEEVYIAGGTSGSTFALPIPNEMTSDVTTLSNSVMATCSLSPPSSQLVLIEATGDILANNSSPNMNIKVNSGSGVAGSKSFLSGNALASAFCTHVTTLSAGSNTIQLIGVGGGGTFPATSPDRYHAQLVVWQVTT